MLFRSDYPCGVFMAILRKRKFFVPVHFLVDLPELYQIQTVIERVDETGGIDFNRLTFTDNICLDEEGKLSAIRTGCEAASPAPASVLGKYFYLENGVYKAKEHIPTLHTVAQLREILYREGFWCDGLHYVRFKRSSGSARVGKCLFIDERLYRQMHQCEFL